MGTSFYLLTMALRSSPSKVLRSKAPPQRRTSSTTISFFPVVVRALISLGFSQPFAIASLDIGPATTPV